MTGPATGAAAGPVAGAAPRPLDAPAGSRLVAGWGRTAPTRAVVRAVSSAAQVADAVRAAAAGPAGRGLLARGLGRSYGDCAQDAGGVLLDLSGLDGVEVDASGVAVVGAGAGLDALLRALVPAGWFVPVTPGTRFVTVGGAVAADVHGKNHHRDGALGAHVAWLELVDGTGALRRLAPDSADAGDAEAFWATVGGMGLTGVVTRVALRLLPVTSALVRVDTERAGDLDGLMARMAAGDGAYRYSVAWVDSLARGAATGRGVLTRGDHADAADLPADRRARALDYGPRVRLAAPPRVPGGLLNRWTVGAFNEAWYRKAPAAETGRLQPVAGFFHPLDAVRGWNRVYGPGGFVQYQFVVPDAGADVVRVALERLRDAGAPSFLTVLKRFGPASPAPLSFPAPGWTLAADVPADVPGLGAVLDGLDERVVAAGGRHYLAKDARMRPEVLRAGYPRLDAWRAARDRMDPAGVFVSDQARRLLGFRGPSGRREEQS